MKSFIVILLILMLTTSLIMAQGTGKIAGFVSDEKGALVGANIFLEGTTMGAATDDEGMYLINQVPVGDYTIIASVVGFKTVKAEITVKEGETVKQDFTLVEDLLLMDAVVVTGTPGGVGIRKRDASFAINTIDATEIERLSPSSTAAVLDVVPGVWSESTGGVAGANIMVRGLPSGGDAPFVTMSINGSPLYGVQTLSFLEQSTLFRIDETVEMTEAARGGPSAVFSNGEAGLAVNFNLRKGGEKTKGRFKYATSDYNLTRFDGFLSGKVADNLYYMTGGYVRTSPGIRDTEFNAENGMQLTMQLTKTFDKGAINFYTRLTNDHGQWVLPMALETGNDLGTFTPVGNATRFRTLQINAQGDSATYDFAKGRGWKGAVSGLNLNFDLGGGWTVSDALSYTSGDANTFGFVPNGNPIKVSALGLDTVRTVGGSILGGSEYVQNYGHWVVMKELEALSNDLSFNKKWDMHNVTFGLYNARWSSRDFWSLGNHVPVHNVENGDMLEVGITADSLAAHGGGGPWNYGVQSAGDANVSAVYLANSWQVNHALRFDLGLRYEMFKINYAVDHGNPDGITDKAESLEGNDIAYTVAVNYDFMKELGVFAGYSKGFLFPQFDMIRENKYTVASNGDIEANQFKQIEFGLKYDTPIFSMFATGFFNMIDVFDGDITYEYGSAMLNTETYGLELDGTMNYNNLLLRAVATYQSGEITKADLFPDIEGNKIWRQPNWQLRLAPSYYLALGKIDATLYGALRMVGKRWDSRDNVFELDGYTKIDAGVVISTGGGISFNIHGDNLNDSEALTEGDPRDPSSANGRPLFGRSIKFSVLYDF